jgi:hypothetical protein
MKNSIFACAVVLAFATGLAGCDQNLSGALSTVQTDLANMEATAGEGLAAMCAFQPILQSDVNAVVALSKLSAQQQKGINSAEAVINTACTNPAATNSAALIAKVGAAIQEVQAIQSGAAQ